MYLAMKLYKSIFAIALVASAFASCQKIEEDNSVNTTKTVSFTATTLETKTAFGEPDGTRYPTLWTANDEKVKVSLNYATALDAKVTPAADFKTANFSVEIKDDETNAYTFYSVSPASAAISINSSYKSWNINFPSSQTPSETSVDENAQILVAQTEEFTEFPTSVKMNYTHLTAYGKMSLLNLNLDGATINSISLTASKNWAGRWYYYPETGSVSESSASATITIETSATKDIWFACAPVDMGGATIKVTVNTTDGPFVKEITMPESVVFERGVINKFAVDMKGIAPEQPKNYTIVTSLSELTEDSEVIIAAADYDFAISTTQNGNNRAQASVTKSDAGAMISDPGDDVQIFTLKKGSVDNTLAFYTGSGYIYAASSSSNYLKTQSTLDENASFSAEISGNVVNLVASGTNTRNVLQYNESSKLFSCYGSASQKAVSIYKLIGSGTDTPIIVADNTEYTITVADAENGTVEASATAAKKGTEITLTITPDEGYLFDAVTVKDADGKDIEVKDNKFTMPASNVIVSATFREKIEGVVEFVFGNNISATSGTLDGVTLSTDQNNGSNPPAYNSNYNQLRLYRYNSMTISSESNIKSIVITYDGTYIGSDTDADNGSYSCDKSVGTWTGSSKAVTITNTGTENVQMRITKIVVTVE